jgi:poly(hydroxyalkanoate) depolymerase family esterase
MRFGLYFRGLSIAALPLVAACTNPPASDDDRSTTQEARAALTEVTSFGSNPGQLKMYEHVPANLPTNAPLLVVLHGCTQRAADIADVGFSELADANGFAVVYPEQQTSNNAVRCFSWASAMGSPDDVTRGKGENESVREMVAKAIATHGSDPKRVYVAGFSAGAAMSIVLAATWPDVFAGAASFAGMPFGCASSFADVSSCMNPGKDKTAEEWGRFVHQAFASYSGPWPKISIWQGTADNVVGPTNRVQLARQWSNVHGVPEAASLTEQVDGHEHKVWKTQAGETVLETYAINGMSHGVPVKPAAGCGRTGQYAIDKGICGSKRLAAYFGLVPSGS